jgi:hypothetical protein
VGVAPVQLSMPTDGKGPRIKVSVCKGEASRVPTQVPFDIDGEVVSVVLEAVEDYPGIVLP